MAGKGMYFIWFLAVPLMVGGVPPFSFGLEPAEGGRPARDVSARTSRDDAAAEFPADVPRLQLAEVDFCAGLGKLLAASSDGFRSVTSAFKETPSGVLVGRGTVQLPGAVLCTAVQHMVSGSWKATYTCHFAGEDETVPKAEADRRFEALRERTRSCVPNSLRERDNTGGEDLGVVSTSFSGDPSGPTVTVFLNYNGGSAEHPSSIDLWLSVARSIPAPPV